MKKFFKEFKEFITRGNVLDMAVGIIVGGAFTAIAFCGHKSNLSGADSFPPLHSVFKKISALIIPSPVVACG